MLLNDRTIRHAFELLGRKLRASRDIEILIVGGAAGVLTGHLPATWTTADVDMIDCRLPQDREMVLEAAADVGKELDLPASWLNDWGGLYFWTLPQGWEVRRVLVGTFGRLHVYAVSRLDLIEMKFIAHRERDLEHLRQMLPTPEELEWVRKDLVRVLKDHSEEAGQIEMAQRYVDAWEPIP